MPQTEHSAYSRGFQFLPFILCNSYKLFSPPFQYLNGIFHFTHPLLSAQHCNSSKGKSLVFENVSCPKDI